MTYSLPCPNELHKINIQPYFYCPISLIPIPTQCLPTALGIRPKILRQSPRFRVNLPNPTIFCTSYYFILCFNLTGFLSVTLPPSPFTIAPLQMFSYISTKILTPSIWITHKYLLHLISGIITSQMPFLTSMQDKVP